jgi:hypothetical protein
MFHRERLARDRSQVYLSSPKVPRIDSMRLHLDSNPVRAGAAFAAPVPSLTGGRTPLRMLAGTFGGDRVVLPNHPYALARRPMR